jgi:hypothetical protein
MPEDIEVKLSPLDEESRAALMAFVNALDGVRASMSDIKDKMATDMESLRRIVQQSGAGSAGSGRTPFEELGGILPGGATTPSGGVSAMGSRAVVGGGGEGRPGYGSQQQGDLTADAGGYGGTGGGGGMSDNGGPYPTSQSNMPGNAPRYMTNSSFYGAPLQIPRINNFNAQDYARMAGKVIAGPSLGRYSSNYDTAYTQGVDSGMTSVDAADQAHQAASAMAKQSGDTGKLRAGRALTAFGQVAPYAAATQGLIPQLLGGGFLGAPGLATNMTASMGLQGQDPTMLGATAGLGEALFKGTFNADRPGTGSESGYRFGRALSTGRDITDPMSARSIGLFSLKERGDFAEASMQTNMRGNEFDVALDQYSKSRTSARPTMAPGQYAELFHEQTRNGAATYDQAATNLKNLADAAMFAGLNVQQMGEAAQAYHASNPQLTNNKAFRQVADYGRAGVTGAMANDFSNNALVQGQMALQYGIHPDAVAGASPASVLGATNNVLRGMSRTIGGSFTNKYDNQGRLVESAAAQKEAKLSTLSGLTAEEVKIGLHGDELGAASNMWGDLGNDKLLKQDLAKMQLPNMNKDGKFSGLSPEQQQAIMDTDPSKRKDFIGKMLQKEMGYDVNDPKTLEEAIKKASKGDAEAQKRLLSGELDDSQKVQLAFTGKAAQWFKQHEDDLPKNSKKPRAKNTSPGYKGPSA